MDVLQEKQSDFDMMAAGRPPKIQQRVLALWAAKRSESLEAFKAILEIRATLRPEFATILRQQLGDQTGKNGDLRKGWQLLCASVMERESAHRLSFLSHDVSLLSGKTLGAEFSEIAQVIAPRLDVRPRFDWERRDTGASESLMDIVRYELTTDGDVSFFTSELISRLGRWSGDARARLLERITTSLIERLDVARDAGLVGEGKFDQSDIDVPSIEPHAQNEHRQGFLPLVEVCVALLGQVDADRVRASAHRLKSEGHRLTHRLWLHALRNTAVFDSSEVSHALRTSKPRLTLTIPREVPLLIQDRLGELDRVTQFEFFEFVVRAARELYPEQTSDEQNRDAEGEPGHAWRDAARDRAVWRILSSAKSGGVVLSSDHEQLFKSIQVRHPWLHHPLRDEDYFDFWVGEVRTVVGNPQLFSDVPADQRVEAAVALVKSAELDDRESWMAYCSSDLLGALQSLIKAPVDKRTAPLWERWMWAVPRTAPEGQSPAGNSDIARGLKTAFAHLKSAPSDVLDGIAYSLVQGLEAAIAHRADVDQDWWERLWASAEREQRQLTFAEDSGYEVIGRALNASGGRLADYVLTTLVSRVKSGDSDRRLETRRVGAIINSKSNAGFLGRASLVREIRFVMSQLGEALSARLWNQLAAEGEQARLLRLVLVETIGLPQAIVHAHWPVILRGARESRAIGEAAEGVAINLLRGCFRVAGEKKGGKVSAHRGEARRLLHDSSDELRRKVIKTLAAWLEAESPETRGDQWNKRYGPVFLAIWPRTARFKAEANSLPLARLIAATGNAFPQVLEALRPYLVPVSDAWPRLPWPVEIGIRAARNHPEEMLSLLWSLFGGRSEPPRIHRIDELLSIILESSPQLGRDRRVDALAAMAFPDRK